jgi:hypothetical protein
MFGEIGKGNEEQQIENIFELEDSPPNSPTTAWSSIHSFLVSESSSWPGSAP